MKSGRLEDRCGTMIVTRALQNFKPIDEKPRNLYDAYDAIKVEKRYGEIRWSE